MNRENPSSIRNGFEMERVNEGQNQIIDDSQGVGGVTGSQTTPVFIETNITAIMEAVFNAPIVTFQSQ